MKTSEKHKLLCFWGYRNVVLWKMGKSDCENYNI